MKTHVKIPIDYILYLNEGEIHRTTCTNEIITNVEGVMSIRSKPNYVLACRRGNPKSTASVNAIPNAFSATYQLWPINQSGETICSNKNDKKEPDFRGDDAFGLTANY